MATDYAEMAAIALSKEFERIRDELLPLAERVMKADYPTQEGHEADAERLCGLSRAVAAVIRTRHIMTSRMERVA